MKVSTRFGKYVRKNVYIEEGAFNESLLRAQSLGMKYPDYLRYLISKDVLEYNKMSEDLRWLIEKSSDANGGSNKYISSKKRRELFNIIHQLKRLLYDW